MSGAASFPPAAQSTTHNLPTDLWLLIFEQEVLDYHDYKSLKRVCKSFYELEKVRDSPCHSVRPFVADLFARRATPSTTASFAPLLRLVPSIAAKMTLFTSSSSNSTSSAPSSRRAFGYYGKDDDEKPDFSALLLMSVFATSPASRRVTIAMSGEALAKNKNGGTVEDVLEACVEMWTSRPDEETCEEIVEIFAEWNPIKAEEVTWRDVLLDHCFYEGMRSASVVGKDWVELTPNRFGS